MKKNKNVNFFSKYEEFNGYKPCNLEVGVMDAYEADLDTSRLKTFCIHNFYSKDATISLIIDDIERQNVGKVFSKVKDSLLRILRLFSSVNFDVKIDTLENGKARFYKFIRPNNKTDEFFGFITLLIYKNPGKSYVQFYSTIGRENIDPRIIDEYEKILLDYDFVCTDPEKQEGEEIYHLYF